MEKTQDNIKNSLRFFIEHMNSTPYIFADIPEELRPYYTPDILSEFMTTYLNNCHKTHMMGNTLFSDNDLMKKHLYIEENKERHLPEVLKDSMDHAKEFGNHFHIFYIEYKNNDAEYVNFINLKNKNMIRFKINFERIKEISDDHYDKKIKDLSEIEQFNYFDSILKFENTQSEYLNDYTLHNSIETMILTNYL